jgi:hypothetical protein
MRSIYPESSSLTPWIPDKCYAFSGMTPSSHRHHTVIPPSPHRHFAVISPSPHRHLTVISPSSHRHLTVTSPSPHRHFAVISPSPHRHLTVIPRLDRGIQLLSRIQEKSWIPWSGHGMTNAVMHLLKYNNYVTAPS